jgi:hypothetical protein
MSDSNLKLTLNAETNFEFELSVKGIDVGEADVRFGLEKNGVHMQFKCGRKSGAWSVNVPPLSSFNLGEGLYKYTIEVIANGYYFAPVKGTAEVAPAAEVSGNLVKKDVKVAVSGIKVTEGKKYPKKAVLKENPLAKPMKKRLSESENKFNSTNRKHSTMSLTRLQELAGIK